MRPSGQSSATSTGASVSRREFGCDGDVGRAEEGEEPLEFSRDEDTQGLIGAGPEHAVLLKGGQGALGGEVVDGGRGVEAFVPGQDATHGTYPAPVGPCDRGPGSEEFTTAASVANPGCPPHGREAVCPGGWAGTRPRSMQAEAGLVCMQVRRPHSEQIGWIRYDQGAHIPG